MPIIVKDADISQNQDEVIIVLPLHQHRPGEVDVTIFENFVKVSYPPYYFESFLSNAVDDLNSSVRFEDEFIVLKLRKLEKDMWPEILRTIEDKEDKRNLRDGVLQRLAETIEERKKSRGDYKTNQGRQNVRAQMKLEQEERERIDKQRELEKRMAFSSVYDLKPKTREELELEDRMRGLDSNAPTSKIEMSSTSEETTKKLNEIENVNSKAIFQPAKSVTINKGKVGDFPLKPLPGVRGAGQISVKFTPRVFPTPSRESQAQEEETWLKKQAEARNIIELDEKELTETEKDPEVMRKKADDFYKQGNYLAAANVYTHVIRLRPKLPALYSNRAACHLRAGNLMKCAEDASKALELLVPAVDSNAKERLLAHIRRGTALAKLELFVEGLADYQAALKLMAQDDPMRVGIENDAETLRKRIQSSDN